MVKDQHDASFEALFTNERHVSIKPDQEHISDNNTCCCFRSLAVLCSYEKQTLRAGSHTLQLLCSESASSKMKAFD